MTLLHMNPNTKLTEKELWRLESLFDLIWWDIKDSLQIEQDKKLIEEAESTHGNFTKLLFDNPSLFRYFG